MMLLMRVSHSLLSLSSASSSSSSKTLVAPRFSKKLFSSSSSSSSSFGASSAGRSPHRRRSFAAMASNSAAAPAATKRLENADDLIDSVETFLFDCDGEDGILKELELAGFQYLGGPEDGDKKIELKPGFLMEHDESVGAVVVGFDRYVNYYKIQYGTLCIREILGVFSLRQTVMQLLISLTLKNGQSCSINYCLASGGGSMVGAIQGSTKREPLVVGKPSTFMMDYLANKFGILKSQICMVGDRLDTDILFGQNGGCKTLLVLSGVTSLQMLQSPENPIQPDFYTNKISDLLTLKAAAV
ncbi:Phosphoglycolate phosphatase 1B, chloroplastic [Ananas comosus]|uniref:Phosphoglycolate phosphatase 1B, chloroplastic n=1 Tax=Ananas comosus TaxID=4615 RepID=A0A199W6E0_ANACO|nr:Phosphoglycolate phosphatase 1B, chloroplastic [Ananas comosus]